MSERSNAFDRRSYLKLTGGAGLTTVGLAGCLEDNGSSGDGGDGDGGDGGDGGNGSDGGDGGDGGDNQIVAGTAPGFPPFEMKEGGDLVGFDVDLLEAIVGETDYQLAEWQELKFDGLRPALNNGNIDVIAAAMTITEERAEQVAFTDPYHSADQAILVQSGGDLQPESFEDLEGASLGAQSGTTGEALIESELIEPGLVDKSDYDSYENYVFAAEDLERGLLDAVVLDDPVAETFASERNVEIAFIEETGEEFGFAVRQDDDDLLNALNEGLAAVEESSQYEEISDEWFGG